ncbi:acetyltransferase [Pedobacter helvus]|uniref:Acetyltransferase n=1 Tax=Pedobacter helvus TaxID=2563444 RepID=A0ABW9JDP3_9SPHI|nr:acetyltransferase [Pedobacter ureilyticus]
MKARLILIGGGGHCKVCIDVIEQTGQFDIIGILDLAELVGTSVLNYQIIGTDQDIAKYVEQGYSFLITVGQIKSVALKEKLFHILNENKAVIATVVAPSAHVSVHSNVGAGTIVMHHVTVNAGAIIGKNCILNNCCDIEHDTIVGDHTHISTGAILNGNCRIGNGVFVGSNATVANQIVIGDKAVIGAGSVVIKNVTAKDIQAGNPAKSINK